MRFADTPEATAWIVDLFLPQDRSAAGQPETPAKPPESVLNLCPGQPSPTADKGATAPSKNLRGQAADECRQQGDGRRKPRAGLLASTRMALPQPQRRAPLAPGKDIFNAGMNCLYGMFTP